MLIIGEQQRAMIEAEGLNDLVDLIRQRWSRLYPSLTASIPERHRDRILQDVVAMARSDRDLTIRELAALADVLLHDPDLQDSGT